MNASETFKDFFDIFIPREITECLLTTSIRYSLFHQLSDKKLTNIMNSLSL